MKLLPLIPIVAFSMTSTLSAASVRLDNTGSPGLGDHLDEMIATPTTVDVPEILGLQMTIHAVVGSGAGTDLNTTSTAFGINSGDAGDVTDRFDSLFSESVTFSFNKDVSISQLDFTSFESGESFQFGSETITYSDLTNATTDIFDFSSPLLLAAHEQFTLSATSGSIGIEAMDVVAVPEPSVAVMLGFAGVVVLLRRKR